MDTNTKSVAIIGGGFSCLALLNKFSKEAKLSNFNYTVFDSNKDIGLGLAYGGYAHDCFLMNSPVCRLNINDDRRDLEHWLINKSYYSNKKTIRSEYIPRKLYGKYLKWRFDYSNLNVTKIDSLINKIVPNEKRYLLETDNNTYSFDYVVVAIGSQENPNFAISSSNNNYFRNIYSNINLLEEKLSNPNSSIAILGTSSAFLDVVRFFQYKNLTKLPKMYAISKSGNIPWPGIVNENVDYNLSELNKTRELSDLVSLLDKEVSLAIENKVSILDIRAKVNAWLKSYFKTLNEDQKIWFMRNAARSFESLMKRGAPTVVDFANKLISDNNLSIISKRISNVIEKNNGKLEVIFENTELEVDLVLNCLGPSSITSSNSKLIQSLIHDCSCEATASKSGLAIDQNFQLRENLFAFGPIITGSFNKHGTFHHLENVRKIYELSSSFISEFREKF